MFNNLYSFNNTLFVVTSDPSSVPKRDLILSAGLIRSLNPYVCFSQVCQLSPNLPSAREANTPTDLDLQIISPQQARDLFGQFAGRLDGVTFMQTDPPQFLPHYFHFVVGASSIFLTAAHTPTNIPSTTQR